MEWTCLGPNDRDVSVASWNMIGHLALEFGKHSAAATLLASPSDGDSRPRSP